MASNLVGSIEPSIAAQFERFVDDVEGETSPAEETPTPTPEVPAAEEPAAPEEAETPVVEDPAEEATPEAAASEEPAADDTIDTLSDLAAAFDVEEKDFLEHLQVTSVEDPSQTVSLQHILNQYQYGPSIEADMATTLESEREKLRTENTEVIQNLENITARIFKRIENHTEPPGGWARLREEEPGEYLRLQELIAADRADARAAVESLEAHTQREREAHETRREQFIEEQAGLLYRMRPEWRDDAVGVAAFEDINHYVQKMGFPEEQIKNLIDAPSIETVWKAEQWDKLQASKPKLKKRLAKLPTKHVVATARDEAAPQREQTKARQAALDKFRESGSIEDGMAFFEEQVE